MILTRPPSTKQLNHKLRKFSDILPILSDPCATLGMCKDAIKPIQDKHDV